MTTVILREDIDKGSFNDDLERTLQTLVDKDGLCKTCGQDHSLVVKLDGVTTTINEIHKLFKEEFEEILEAGHK